MIEMITYKQDENSAAKPTMKQSGGSTGAKTTKAKSVASTWKPFILNLTDVLNDMEQGQLLTLQKVSPLEWIQFAPQGKSIRIECKSNAYREAHEQLTVHQVAELADIGWLVPTGSPEESTPSKDKFGSPNHFVDLPLPLKPKALSGLVVRTFTEVFSTALPQDLVYEAYGDDKGSLSLPDLGLKPQMDLQDVDLNPKLAELLLSVAKEITNIPDLVLDCDGDIGPVGYKDIRAYLRLVEGSKYVRIYSPILMQIAESPALLTKLNDLNTINGFMHLCHMPNGCVMAVSDVLATPFISSYVATALGNFLQVTSDCAIEVIAEFGDDGSDVQPALWH